MPHRHIFSCPPCRTLLLILAITLLPGCTVVKVVDATASTAIGVTMGTVKMTGKAIGAAIPEGDEDKEDNQQESNN